MFKKILLILSCSFILSACNGGDNSDGIKMERQAIALTGVWSTEGNDGDCIPLEGGGSMSNELIFIDTELLISLINDEVGDEADEYTLKDLNREIRELDHREFQNPNGIYNSVLRNYNDNECTELNSVIESRAIFKIDSEKTDQDGLPAYLVDAFYYDDEYVGKFAYRLDDDTLYLGVVGENDDIIINTDFPYEYISEDVDF